MDPDLDQEMRHLTVKQRPALRLAAGALALALPLAAVAACGAEKRKTVAQELTAATTFLGDSKAAAFTLRFDDARGNLAKAAAKDGDMPEEVADALLGGSLTYVVDAAGDKTLRSLQEQQGTDATSALKDVNLAFVLKDDKAELLELRLVDGTLYAHVDLDEVGRLARLGGAEDFDASLDEAVAGADPRLAEALRDVRAGAWLTLPLEDFVDDLKGLAESVVPGGVPTAAPKGYDADALGSKVLDAVRPYVTATDANDSSSDRVIDVKVKVRPALKALLSVLKAEKDLPFAGALSEVVPSDIDENVSDAEAHGTIRLEDSHLTQVSVDLDSLRKLAKDPGGTDLAGVSVVLDIDDSADEVEAPTGVKTVDVGALLEDLIGGFFGPAFEDSASAQAGVGFSG